MITPRLLKLSAKCMAELLCVIFNTAIAQSMYLAAWKRGQITPIPTCKGSDSEIDKTIRILTGDGFTLYEQYL